MTILAPAAAGQATLYNPYELTFAGPVQGPSDSPARDIDFKVTFQHESGEQITVHGFWDGNGAGGASGNVFKVRFAPTLTGNWSLAQVQSNRVELNGQQQGTTITAQASTNHGFWIADPASPGGRWYQRSDGTHQYIVGNTQYSFLSGVQENGTVRPNIPQFIKSDVENNAEYFTKLRFGLYGDINPHPTDKPFFSSSGTSTNDGDNSLRPNPTWFHDRVDLAVQTAFDHDMIADLILAGPDSSDARSTLRADQNGGDPTPYLKYIAARYGSYSNVWIALANEFDIKSPSYTAQQIIDAGKIIKQFLPYETPVSVHRDAGDWNTSLNSTSNWNDHVIIQKKLKDLSDSADAVATNFGRGGSDRPVVNDELSYTGAGDGHSEADTIEAFLGAFIGGGYATTGYKTGSKTGEYFDGGFNAAEHLAADNLAWFADRVDEKIPFYRMTPMSLASSIFTGADSGFRAMQWSGREYLLATDLSDSSITANLPEGLWRITRYDLISKSETVLSEATSGPYAFGSTSSRAALYQFTSVPEPTAAIVAVPILLAAGGRRRRRRQ